MTKLLSLLLLIGLTGCQGSTEYGKCIGLGEEEKPNLEYRASTRNIILSVLFIETIFVPVVVALNEVYCPVGEK